MRALGYLFVTFMAALAMIADAQAQGPAGSDRPKHLAMRLVAETPTPAAGREVTLAIDSRPVAGWHG